MDDARIDADISPDPLDDLVFDCLERMETQGDQALLDACRAHPEQADRLRSRVNTLAKLGLMGRALEEFPERLGDFRLMERLGEGGMGVVYRAEQIALGRSVALKVLRPESLYFAGARERFEREMALAGRMSHPGIVPVYAVGEEKGVPFLAMELAHGRTLEQVIRAFSGRDPKRLSGLDLFGLLSGSSSASKDLPAALEGSWVRTCVALTLQVARALEHAHSQGVLHRDVKPSNVIVSADGRARLLDFGLAVAQGVSRLTRTGAQVGSLGYMPPEQVNASGQTVNERSDVYSLGVTFYELLTLRMPYSGNSPVEVMRAIELGHASPPRQLNPEVSWDVETCCLTAMEPDPSRRYDSAAAMARDLEHTLALRPIEARPASTGLRAQRFIRRHSTWVVSGAAVLALALVGPWIYAVQQRRARIGIESANAATTRANAELGVALKQVETERDAARRENQRAERNFNEALNAVNRFSRRAL